MIDDIIEQHASESAYLWTLRELAARSPHYELEDLSALDLRVDAHLDGLRLSGDAGWKACDAALDAEEPGEVFVAMDLATDRFDLKAIARVLDVGASEPALQHAIVSGLAWNPFDRVRRILPGLLDARCPPELHLIGIAACVAHRVDPGPALEASLYSDNTRLRATALRALGELWHPGLLHLAKPHLQSPDDDCRFSAAWSLTLIGDGEGTAALQEFARSDGPRCFEASALSLRRLDIHAASVFVRELASAPETARVGIIAAGHAGTSEFVPWLLQCMEVPEHARVAGESFSLITGVDLARARLAGRAPGDHHAGPTDDKDDDEVAMDPDEALPWPDAGLVRHWWSSHRNGFSGSERYLLGHPPSAAWCERILREGYQRQRMAAALELSRFKPGKPLFPVYLPGFRQRQLLG